MQKAAEWTTTKEYAQAEDKEQKAIGTNQEDGTVASDAEQGQGRKLLRENSKVQRFRHSGTEGEHHGCKEIGRSIGVFVALTALLVVFVVVTQGEVDQEFPSDFRGEPDENNDVDDIRIDPELQCNLPCATSRQRSIAELVLGHDICPCVTIESISTNSSGTKAGASIGNTDNSIESSSCDCSPEERALQWILEDDIHFSYNEVVDEVSKTFLMERFALATFYYSTGGKDDDDDTTTINPYGDNNWLSRKFYNSGGQTSSGETAAVNHCSWQGVACNNIGVTGLFMQKIGLSGEIPTILGALDKLEILMLSDNDFTSTIPKVITELQYLSDLDLIGNKLNNSIPTELGDLTNLVSLKIGGRKERRNSISHNRKIPTELGRLHALEHLRIVNTNVDGEIPEELGRLSSLKYLSLERNALRGPIPTEIGQLASLKILSLEENNFSGPIPVEIGSLIQVEVFDLNRNSFTGGIPNTIGALTMMETINLSGNLLNGTISEVDFLPLASTLKNIDLHSNSLTGVIPERLGAFEVLEAVDLSYNLFTGEISESLGTPQYLKSLRLEGNAFLEGKIPDELCKVKIASDTFHHLSANCNICPGEVSGVDGDGNVSCCSTCII